MRVMGGIHRHMGGIHRYQASGIDTLLMGDTLEVEGAR